MSKTFAYKLRECLCNNKKDELNALMASPEFTSENMTIELYVELIQIRWDAATVMKFAALANNDQLATLIATAILQAHAVRLKPIFALLKDVKATIQKHHLTPLFLVACDHEDADAVKVMIEYKCFDPTDGRAILTVLRKSASRAAPVLELVSSVLEAFPGHKDDAQYALDNWVASAKHEQTKQKLTEMLNAYLSQ